MTEQTKSDLENLLKNMRGIERQAAGWAAAVRDCIEVAEEILREDNNPTLAPMNDD